MHGVITEFDAKDGVGIIDAEDGELVLFSSANVQLADEHSLRVGTRVTFLTHRSDLGLHADVVHLEH